MRFLLSSLFLVSLMALGPMAQAQETAPAETTEPAPQDDAAPAEGAAPEEGATADLAQGEPVGPRVGQPYVLEEFGDWSMRCVRAPEGQADPCNLYQLLTDDNGAAVAEFNFFRLPEGANAAAGATIVVPLETLLTQQLTLSVDGANARRYPFTFCNTNGCVARLGFTTAEIDQLKRGKIANIRLVPAAAPAEEVILTVSLNGFTAGYDGVVTTSE